MTVNSDEGPDEGRAAMARAVVIADAEALVDFLEAVAVADGLALAAEANTMHAYRAEVCLVQAATWTRGGAVHLFAIDALAFKSQRQSPLADVLARLPAGARVVVHGGEYTMAALKRDNALALGGDPRIVDTQQAAVLLGLPETGYRSLCRGLLGVTLPAPISVDWHLRPLAPGHVAHALQDVAHLPELWRVLADKIARADLEAELALASELVAATPARANTPNPNRFRHIEGAAGLPPEGLALLDTLVRWRDQKAKELDVPPGKLMPNAQIVALARRPERAVAELERIRFHSRLLHGDREALRRQVVMALAGGSAGHEAAGQAEEAAREAEARQETRRAATTSPARALPARPARILRAAGPPTPEVKARVARLKRWRREEAAQRGVGLQAILPGAALEHLAWFSAPDLAELEHVPHLGARRIERYGATLLALCRG